MHIGIVSLGLIGGSILKALSKYPNIKITAVTRNKQTIDSAKSYTDKISDKLETLQDCDVVFVCSPMNKTISILRKLESILSPKTIVTDVSSLKEFVTKETFNFKFIGSHPMAGTEHSGFNASFAELFQGSKWILTPQENTSNDDIKKLESIINLMGSHIIKTTAKEHDEAAAIISHMPMLLAQALMETALDNTLALKMASSGFRDMTRLACSNTEMAEDMININKKAITKALNKLIGNANNLLETDYRNKIAKIKEYRTNMYDSHGKNTIV